MHKSIEAGGRMEPVQYLKVLILPAVKTENKQNPRSKDRKFQKYSSLTTCYTGRPPPFTGQRPSCVFRPQSLRRLIAHCLIGYPGLLAGDFLLFAYTGFEISAVRKNFALFGIWKPVPENMHCKIFIKWRSFFDCHKMKRG